MSRSNHTLRSEQWYGGWAGYIRHENRETRARGREKRDADRERVDARQVAEELAAARKEARIEAATYAGDDWYEHDEERRNWGEYLEQLEGTMRDDELHDAYDGIGYDGYNPTDDIEEYDPRYDALYW